MAESQLWLVNHSGTVFSLPTSRRHCSQLQTSHGDPVPVKRLSSARWCAWAVGHDHRPYLYVFSSDVPIRIPETTYENQRWSIIRDYSKKGLIRTDRPAWSDESGKQERPKESVRLPSAYWVWDSDWFIDDNLRGEVVVLGGWQYAVDFPAQYTPEQHWNSFVRRRKWTRFRSYAGTDIWARISDMEVVENSECFIDISVGCSMLPSQPKGFLSVWAVMNNGKVYARTNVHHENPEGSAWGAIDVGSNQGVINISVGATNLIWAITWDGRALVRTEVSRDNLYGLGWEVVEFPDETTRLMQVAVGRNAVWAISRDGKVWFRKGTWGDNQFWSSDSAVGKNWIEMVGEMSHITVSAKDQVFAIDVSDRFIYFRTGISHHDLTGKTWQRVTIKEDLSYFYDLGLMADGRVCSCGDADANNVCEIHSQSRDRNLSTSTSCSNLSTSFSSSIPRDTEEADGSTDMLMTLLQPSQPKLKSLISLQTDNLPPAWAITSESNVSGTQTPDEPQISETQSYHTSEKTDENISSYDLEPLIYNDSHFATSPQLSDKSDCSEPKSQATDLASVTLDDNIARSTSASSHSSPFSKSAATAISQSSSVTVNQKLIVSHKKTADDGHVQTCLNFDESKDKDSLAKKELSWESNMLDKSSCTDIKELKNEAGQYLCKGRSILPTQAQSNVSQCSPKQSLETVCCASYDPSDKKVQQVCVEIEYKNVTKVTQNSEESTSDLNSHSDLTEVDRDFNFLGVTSSLTHQQQEREKDQNDVVQTVQECNLNKKKSKSDSLSLQSNISSNNSEEICVDQSHDRLPHSKEEERVLQTVPSNNQNKSDNSSETAALSLVDDQKTPLDTISNEAIGDQTTAIDSFHNEAITQPEGRRPSKSQKRRSSSKSSGSLGAAVDDSIVFKPRKKKEKIKKIKAEVEASEDGDSYLMSSDVSQQAGEEGNPRQTPEGVSAFSVNEDTDQLRNGIDMVFDEANLDVDVFSKKPSTVNSTILTDISDMKNPEINDSASWYIRNDESFLTSKDQCAENVSKREDDNEEGGCLLESRGVLDADAVTNSKDTSGDKFSNKMIKREESEGQLQVSFTMLSECHLEIKQYENGNKALNVKEGESSMNGSENVQTFNSLKTEKLKGGEESEDDYLKTLQYSELVDKTSMGVNLSKHDNELEQSNAEKSSREESENGSFMRPSEAEVSVSASPENLQRTEASKLTQSSVKRIPMTKLKPSVKKANANGFDSEFDDIVDFVTDLQSTENVTGQFEEGDGQSVDAKMTDDETVQALVSDLIDSHQTRIGTPEQSMEGKIASGKRSSSSSVTSFASLTGVMGNQFYNSYSASNSSNFRRTSLFRQTPSPVDKSSQFKIDLENLNEDSLPYQDLMAAQPRQSWKWLDATSCLFDDPAKIDWLSRVEPEDEPETGKCKISKAMRDTLLKQIQARNQKVITKFASVQSAIEKSTWVRKANMQVYQHGRYSRWISCTIELEQGIQDREQGTLTVHYSRKRSQENKYLSLADLTCVKMSSDPDLPTAFTIYTAQTNMTHKPLMLKASSEMEASEWLGHLSYARAAAWNLNSPISTGAVWSCSFIGDVLVSPSSQSIVKPYERCWGQHGGHMAMVETSPCGVTWGLGFDKQAYIYNGGFGGAVCTGQNDMSSNLEQFSDNHRIFVYENQKWFPLVGWCNKGVFKRDFHWITSTGQFVKSRDDVKLPSFKWHWTSEWSIDFSIAGGVDKSGWQYSVHFDGPFHQGSYMRDHYRRRRWFRRCNINLMAPWTTVGTLPINDVSLQIDSVNSPTDLVIMWAVGANGDVLCRVGVTQSNPMGLSWVHVTTYLDKPFTSISVGGHGRVWGVAADGSAWYRTGVTQENPTGKFWSQVVPPPPSNFRLRQVSVGEMAVWAVDTGDNLWKRENVTESYPEGTDWIPMGSKVKRVSVGCQDQVWIVADSYFQKSKHGPGVVYHRIGITEKCPGGTDWASVIGSGWAHVSVRGLQEA